MKTSAVIVAAGQAIRFAGDLPKQFTELCGRPMLSWTISRFEAAASIDEIVVVVQPDYLLYMGESLIDPYGFKKVRKVVTGGETRQCSVYNGLRSLAPSTEFVAIHDGARPLVTPEDIDATVACAREHGAAMLAARIPDTVKRVEDGLIVATLDRHFLFAAQTPQVFRYDMICQAHENSDGRLATDDASLLEAQGIAVHIVEPTQPNLKITTKDDLRIAEALMKGEQHG